MLIGKDSIKEEKMFMGILVLYKKASDQEVHFEETNIFFFNTALESQIKITHIFKCKTSELPSIYLYMLLFVGQIKKAFWDNIIDKIKSKFSSWKEAMLSHACKLQLIKTTL